MTQSTLESKVWCIEIFTKTRVTKLSHLRHDSEIEVSSNNDDTYLVILCFVQLKMTLKLRDQNWTLWCIEFSTINQLFIAGKYHIQLLINYGWIKPALYLLEFQKVGAQCAPLSIKNHRPWSIKNHVDIFLPFFDYLANYYIESGMS